MQVWYVEYKVTDGSSYEDHVHIDFEVILTLTEPLISVPPVDDTYELGSGPVAYTMTVLKANANPLAISFDSGNAILDGCCSVAHTVGDTYDATCTCSDMTLVNGDADVTYTVTLIANDGTNDSPPESFDLTVTSPNKKPVFIGL